MTRWRVLVALAVLGVFLAVVVVIDTNRAPATRTRPPWEVHPPFASYIVGTGVTENRRGNVAVGTAVAGVVREIDVRVGDRVVAGQPLFRIDDRDLRARRDVAQAGLRRAEAAVAQPRHQLDYLARVHALAPGDVSAESLTRARDAVAAAEAEAGAARAAQAQVDTDLERLVVRAPAPGRVLQLNVRVGEFADSNPTTPLVLLGDATRMYLRVEIDEYDAWRVHAGARGWAVLRGNAGISVPLRYEYTEPYMVPRTALTGQPTERPDQRVLQVVYSFVPGRLPLYLGQRMDAYIETPPVRAAGNGG